MSWASFLIGLVRLSLEGLAYLKERDRLRQAELEVLGHVLAKWKADEARAEAARAAVRRPPVGGLPVDPWDRDR